MRARISHHLSSHQKVSRLPTLLLRIEEYGKVPQKCACTRANPGSEFVLANTLAKWKKLEPNEINFSQKVVSTSCFVFNSLPARGDFCCLLITFANSWDPDQA